MHSLLKRGIQMGLATGPAVLQGGNMKYIKGKKGGIRQVILFTSGIDHDEMASMLDEVTSAGFVTVHGGNVSVHEKQSSTLNMGPAKDDATFIEAYLGIE